MFREIKITKKVEHGLAKIMQIEKEKESLLKSTQEEMKKLQQQQK